MRGIADMAKMAEVFGFMRQHAKDKKARRLRKFLESPLVSKMTEHTPRHWSMELQGHRLDFWPSTARWRWMNRTYWGDLESFSNFLKYRS